MFAGFVLIETKGAPFYLSASLSSTSDNTIVYANSLLAMYASRVASKTLSNTDKQVKRTNTDPKRQRNNGSLKLRPAHHLRRPHIRRHEHRAVYPHRRMSSPFTPHTPHTDFMQRQIAFEIVSMGVPPDAVSVLFYYSVGCGWWLTFGSVRLRRSHPGWA